VSGIVFYDENGNGLADQGEDVRLPHVVVTMGGRAAESGADGSFVLTEVPAGTRTTEVRAETLPPYFRAGRLFTVAVPLPEGAKVGVPIVLPIGGNRPNSYLAFGDSITAGDGSRGARGYRGTLQSRLRAYWGRAEMINDGEAATRSDDGAGRIGASLAAERPAYVLILYGTNDWNLSACRSGYIENCFTTTNLRSMVRQAKAAGSMPIVGTVIPVNPAYVDRLAEVRNGWIVETNAAVKAMARQEGAVVADLHAAMMRETGDLPSLFSDHVHPNDRGYAAMAEEFFRAITQPVGTGTASEAAPRLERAAQDAIGSSENRQRPRLVGRRSACASVRR
jgi:lysophospholipase L1-like esterase